MNRTLHWSAAALVAFGIALAASPASAQRPLQQVLDLNRQAMEAYMNLELEQAQSTLDQALDTAQRGNVTGAALARTYLNLGVVAVGGFGDNGRGLNFFIQAIQSDNSIQLDPLTSTPEISTVFALAQQRAGSGGGNNTPPPDNGNGGNNAPPPDTSNAGNLPHMAVPEQLAQTAVPIYIEVPGNPANVYVFYRGHGMREFNRQEMQTVADGYGYEIPCSDVFQPSVEYYIVAFGSDGSPIGFAGTQNEPIAVQIVTSRTQPAPALPGRAPPETCGETECPPGMSGCASGGGAGMGASCISNSDCGSGLVCDDDLCVTGSGGGTGDIVSDDNGMPRFFLHVGGFVAMTHVEAGMQADTCPPSVTRGLDPAVDAQCGPPGPEEAYVVANSGDPNNLCPLQDGQFCVRVTQPGAVVNGGLRIAAGGYFLPFLGAAVFARFQPNAGYGDLSFFLIGARLQAQLTTPSETGLNAHVFVGTSVGQIQAQPPRNGDNAPWIISGLNGLSFGGIFGYRFHKHFGIYAQVDFMLQFPTFLFNGDISAGIETGF